MPNTRHHRHPVILLLSLVLLAVARPAIAEQPISATDRFAECLQPLAGVIAGSNPSFELRGHVEIPIDDKPQQIDILLSRFDDESFDLDLSHRDYALRLRRRGEVTALALPKHGVVFLGKGQVDEADRLSPLGSAERLISSDSKPSFYLPMTQQLNGLTAATMLTTLAGARFDSKTDRGVIGNNTSFHFDSPGSLTIDGGDLRGKLSVSQPGAASAADDWPGMKVVEIERRELERTLARGLRRAFAILLPSKVLTDPIQRDRKVEHGRLQWIGGQRVVLLEGTPEQIGRAHGELLKSEAVACIDSVLYTFGTVQTIRSGRWFRHDLDAAYQRLRSHIPERHLVETRAMGRALGLDAQLVAALNVFPEMFHCSGFAVFGSATNDGKLYHGRVLDYMTTIGLQDAATTFVVKAEGQIPFVNVGYAGFTGSVSGMNARAISLGEMGGGGEGQWDGVPMATLMRRALEECSTLDEVMELWTNSPRTCEYYYVFADGKTNRAVGVAAVPESIEFVLPGQSDPRLGDGIKDAVVLSSGSRLAKLRERVLEKHGKIDAELGKWLMSRPVAMQSNLHNVLFVPEDGILFVANADHRHPAAERPYVRLDLHQLLRSMEQGPALSQVGD